MATPLLQTQIEINAPVAKVWGLVSDLRRMPQWSPQCVRMQVFGPLRPGARAVNFNRRKFMFWPTTATITEVIPEQKLAFRINTNGSVWAYELEPTAGGTRLTETRHAENGVKPVSEMLVKTLMGGPESFEQELLDGMNESLAKIKAAAES